jgi:hypothetical protein
VYRLNVHFEYLERPFAVVGIVAGKAVGIADKAVGIADIVAAGIADIVAVGKAVGLAAKFCWVELPIPSLMTILIIIMPLLKFSF